MKVRIHGRVARSLPRVLMTAHGITLVAGAGLIAWPLFVAAESGLVQWSGEQELTVAQPGQEPIVAPRAGVKTQQSRHRKGDVLGRLEVPRLKLAYVLLEGTDSRTLDKSIGHVEGTSDVGSEGNICIAGHRNTHFRKLERVHRGDDVILTSRQGKFRYRVEWARLFSPNDSDVLDASHGPAVTLITCYPFEYAGSAPLRFVVRALPVEETRDRLQAPPATGGGQAEDE